MFREPDEIFETSETDAGNGFDSEAVESASTVLGALPVLDPAIQTKVSKKNDTKDLLTFCELLIDVGLVDMKTVTPQPAETFIAQHATGIRTLMGAIPTLHPTIHQELRVDNTLKDKYKFVESMIDSGEMDIESMEPMPVSEFMQKHMAVFVDKHLGKLKWFEVTTHFDFGDVNDQFSYIADAEPNSFLLSIDNRSNRHLHDFVVDFSGEKKFLDQFDPKIMKAIFWIFKQFSPYVGGIGTAEWFCEDYPPGVIYALLTEEEAESEVDYMYELNEDQTLKFFRKRATAEEADVVKPRKYVFKGQKYQQLIEQSPVIQPLLDHIQVMHHFIRHELKSAMYLDWTVEQKYFPFFIPTVNPDGRIWEIIEEKNRSDCGEYCYLSTQMFVENTPEFFKKFAVSLKAISLLDTCVHLLNQLPVPAQAN